MDHEDEAAKIDDEEIDLKEPLDEDADIDDDLDLDLEDDSLEVLGELEGLDEDEEDRDGMY